MKTIVVFTALAVLGNLWPVQAQLVRKPLITVFASTSGVPNPQNPYDQIGRIHNEGLASVANALEWQRVNVNPETVYTQTGQFLDSRNMTRNFAEAYQQAKSSFDAVAQRRTSTDEAPVGLSPKAAGYYKQAMDIISTSDGSTAKPIAYGLMRIESSVMNDATLAKEEQSALLASLAVGRYSADYWINFTTQNVTALSASTDTQFTSNVVSTSSKVKGVIKADIAGAISGAISGAIKGALAGPAVEGGAVGVGAAAGAIAGSVVEGIFSFF